MLSRRTRFRSAATLLWVAAVTRAGARRMRAAGKRLDAWLEARRVAPAPLSDFGRMSERELLDIGLTPVDMHSVLWNSSDQYLGRQW
jgi:hypothetical protein